MKTWSSSWRTLGCLGEWRPSQSPDAWRHEGNLWKNKGHIPKLAANLPVSLSALLAAGPSSQSKSHPGAHAEFTGFAMLLNPSLIWPTVAFHHSQLGLHLQLESTASNDGAMKHLEAGSRGGRASGDAACQFLKSKMKMQANYAAL